MPLHRPGRYFVVFLFQPVNLAGDVIELLFEPVAVAFHQFAVIGVLQAHLFFVNLFEVMADVPCFIRTQRTVLQSAIDA